jgi:hypothetical protein
MNSSGLRNMHYDYNCYAQLSSLTPFFYAVSITPGIAG